MARILIVDDDPDFVEATKLCLEHAGHEVIWAPDRDDGMRLAEERDVELLILDIMMVEPDDGIVMAQDLRRRGFTRPILMMSSISKVTGMSYGRDDEVTPVDEFLEKPADLDALTKKIESLLSRRPEGGPSC